VEPRRSTSGQPIGVGAASAGSPGDPLLSCATRRDSTPDPRAHDARSGTVTRVILVGLTGGIGSGKSTVSELLIQLGAVLIDADAIVRELQAPGAPLLAELAARFGNEIITPDGALDRQALADRVFSDPAEVKALNKIVHPAVNAEMARRVAAHAATDDVVVLDIPLLTENPRDYLQGKIVVDVPVEVQVERLVRYRGFDEADARARIARQSTREQRLEGAGFVVDNSGAPADLEPQLQQLWAWLTALPQLPADFDVTAQRTQATTEPKADSSTRA
jgi:dephospho-CoA kinase